VWVQAASSYYLGFFVFLMAGALGFVRCITGGKQRGRQALFLGSAVGSAALAILPLSLPYLKTIPQWKEGFASTAWNVPAYLFPTPSDASWPGWLGWWALPAIGVIGAAVGLGSRRHRPLAAGLLLTAILGAQLGSGARRLFSLDPTPTLHGWRVPGWLHARLPLRHPRVASTCFLVAPDASQCTGVTNDAGRSGCWFRLRPSHGGIDFTAARGSS
jgi:hypothetical protein